MGSHQSVSAPKNRKSTRQLLEKIPNFPRLYRHSLSSTHYGICKVRGNRKEHSLKTADRKVAERRLKDWIAGLKETNSEIERLTLAELLRKFVLASEGKSEKPALRTRQSSAVSKTPGASAWTSTSPRSNRPSLASGLQATNAACNAWPTILGGSPSFLKLFGERTCEEISLRTSSGRQTPPSVTENAETRGRSNTTDS